MPLVRIVRGCAAAVSVDSQRPQHAARAVLQGPEIDSDYRPLPWEVRVHLPECVHSPSAANRRRVGSSVLDAGVSSFLAGPKCRVVTLCDTAVLNSILALASDGLTALVN